MSHIFREIEQAIAKEKTKDARHGIIADLEESNLNCINFSDTIIFLDGRRWPGVIERNT